MMVGNIQPPSNYYSNLDLLGLMSKKEKVVSERLTHINTH